MCALFCILGGVGLNNRLFRKKSAKSKAKKLEMVLRRLTRGTMTVEQTRQLQSVLGYRRQYQMQVCSSKQTFRSAVAPSQDVEEKKMVLTLLDGKETTENALLATLVCRQVLGKIESTVYFYLPKQKEVCGMTREQKKQKRNEVLTIMGLMALLVFTTRLWPILLLMMIGVFAYALWLLFHLEKQPEPPSPLLLGLPAPVSEETVLADAFSLLQRRITEQIVARYPDAKWIWAAADARERFEKGGELIILLNRAGGYRMAMVLVNHLQFCGLDYTAAEQTPPPVPETELESEEDDAPKPRQETVDYGLLAFEWVDANLQNLNAQCNEVIAQGKDTFRIFASQLPHGDSWPLICKELLRNGFASAEPLADGIQVQIKIK